MYTSNFVRVAKIYSDPTRRRCGEQFQPIEGLLVWAIILERSKVHCSQQRDRAIRTEVEDVPTVLFCGLAK